MKATPDVAYLGLPGTGKTTALMDDLSAELDAGRPVSDIAASTFRTDMAAEFQARAREVVGDLPDGHKLRTTHSLAFRLLGLNSDDVVDDSHKAAVCENIGVRFQGSQGDADDSSLGASNGSNLGDDLFRLVSYCRNTGLDPVSEWRSVHTLAPETRRQIGRTGGEIIEQFVDEYGRFKADNGLVDFDGMLEQCVENGLTPNAGLLIEDEFQDKSPLQVEVFETWAENADKVIVAGDPYQAIYSYMGADPEFMVTAHTRAENAETLDRSYRFGPELWSLATEILTRADYNVPEIKPVGETAVNRIDQSAYHTHVAETAAEDTLHLTRCNYMLSDVAKTLSNAGIAFDNLGSGHRWTSRQVALYNGICKVTDVLQRVDASPFGTVPDFSTLALPEIEAVITALRATLQSGTKKGNLSKIQEAKETGARDLLDLTAMIDFQGISEEIRSGNPFTTRVLTTSGVGSESQRQRLRRSYEQRDGELITEITHAIGTIHAAKGMGATNVFLHNELSSGIERGARPFPRYDKDEARVFFVGATRAQEQLYVVDSNATSRFNFPTA